MCEKMTIRETWQFWAAARRILGDGTLLKIHHVDRRQLQRWSADPRFAESSQANPDDRFELICERLIEAGRMDVAKTRIARIAAVVGCGLHELEPAEPDKDSLEAECCDDVQALARFQRLLLDPSAHPVEVREAWQEARRELDENWEMYQRSRGLSHIGEPWKMRTAVKN